MFKTVAQVIAKPVTKPLTQLLEFKIAQTTKHWVNGKLDDLAKRRDLKQQIASLKIQIDNEPTDIELRIKLAECYAELEMVKEAITAYRYVFDNKPNNTDAFEYLLNQALLQTQYDDAQTLLNQYQNNQTHSIIQTTLDELNRFNTEINEQIAKETNRKQRKQLHYSKKLFTDLIRYSLMFKRLKTWSFDEQALQPSLFDYQSHAQTFADIANMYSDIGLYREQSKNLELSIAMDKLNQHIDKDKLIQLGRIYNEDLNEKKLSLDYFKQLATILADNGRYHAFIGSAYADLNLLEKAQASFSKALVLLPENDEVHYLYGQFNDNHLYQSEVAKQHFEKALKLKPFNELYLNSLGLSHQNNNQFLEANHFYQQAILHTKTSVQCYISLGKLLAEQFQQPNLGLQYCNHAIKLLVNQSKLNLESLEEAYIIKAFILHAFLKQTDQAISCLQSALELNPNNYSALCQLGVIHLTDLKNYDQAIDLFEQALQHRPHDIVTMYHLAICYRTLKNYDKTKMLCQQILAIDHTYSTTHYLLAVVLNEHFSNNNLAIEHYRQAIKFDPQYYEATLNLALLLWKKNGVNEARELLTKAINIEPNQFHAHVNLAILLQQHFYEPELELEHLSTALHLNPNLSQANAHRSRIAELQQILNTSDSLPLTIEAKPIDSFNIKDMNYFDSWNYADITKQQYQEEFYGEHS